MTSLWPTLAKNGDAQVAVHYNELIAVITRRYSHVYSFCIYHTRWKNAIFS